MLKILRTRAWIFHCLLTCWRIYALVTGTDQWLTEDDCYEYEDSSQTTLRDVCPEYNKELLVALTPATRVLISIIFIFGLIIDILCFKYRSLAQTLCYVEGLIQFIYIMIPTKNYMLISNFQLALN